MINRQLARPPKFPPPGLAPRPKNPLATSPIQTGNDTVASLQNRTPVSTPPVNNKLHVINPKYSDYYSRKHAILKNQAIRSKKIGATVDPHYRPGKLIANPLHPSEVTLENLLASQSHLGHATSLWNPRNSRYIFGIRQGIHIISLDVTAAHLRRACRVVSAVAERAGLILFVGTRKGQRGMMVNAAKLAGGYHLFERWTPGTLTNGTQILGNCPTKCVDEFDVEIPEHIFPPEERPPLKPDLVVCMNPMENWTMLHECGLYNIPSIGIIDTNADPSWITYPIPANDDSLRCVELISGALGRAGQEGQEIRMKRAQQGIINYAPLKLSSKDKRKEGVNISSLA
ncbi:37S ribosomal protein, mitochondrial [Pseudocyphellaria aurata]|nr:37S ribosomal protein, mitochondrial [Pseudocyphellaria aurata]